MKICAGVIKNRRDKDCAELIHSHTHLPWKPRLHCMLLDYQTGVSVPWITRSVEWCKLADNSEVKLLRWSWFKL